MSGTQAGWRHFADADWGAARDAFSEALAELPSDPEALDGLGQSLWFLGEREEAIDRRREAYAAYRALGETVAAGRIAAYLAAEERIDGRHAAAAGWLARARRLLADEPQAAAHGWLAIEEAKAATDDEAAERHARAALDLAHALGDADVECMALAQLGSVAVRQGRIDDGLALLDEAMTVALGGESSDPLACGDACCTTLVVCDGLADLDRATQWCEAVVEFTERRRFVPVQSWCRGIYGAVLVRAGDWKRAEQVLIDALRRPADRRRAHGHALPLSVLAELRLRQGRTDEAARLLDGLEEQPVALAPLVRLALEGGDVAYARALHARHEEAVDGHVAAATAAAIALADGDPVGAAAAAERLRGLAEAQGRDELAAEAAVVLGRAALLPDVASDGTADLERAVEIFGRLTLPYEQACARLELARVQAASGSPLAVVTARAARDTLEGLGAKRDADEASALLRELGVSGRVAGRGLRGELTAREREVLELIAGGHSNAEIARRLVIAPKTAEHHVSRVLAKLGVRSRAEAAAHAVREGL